MSAASVRWAREHPARAREHKRRYLARKRAARGVARDIVAEAVKPAKPHGARWLRLVELAPIAADNPKDMAHALVHRAVLLGELTRPDECSVCGSRRRVLAHPDDYDRPLDVRWVCRWCHHRIHHPSAA